MGTLLERSDLLTELRALVARAGEGDGSLALIAGEAGAGKSSLVRTLLEELGDSAVVLEGACDPLSTPRPLSPLLDFAADPDGGLRDLFADDAGPIEVFGQVFEAWGGLRTSPRSRNPLP